MAGNMGAEGVSAGISVVVDVHRASLGWPRVEQYGGVADQLRRSSKSVCALLVEGAAVNPVRMPSSAAICRWRWVRPTKRGCGATMPPIWITCRARSLAWQDELSQIARMLHGLRAACLKTDD